MTGNGPTRSTWSEGEPVPPPGAKTGHCPVRRGSRVPHGNRTGGRRGRLGRPRGHTQQL